MSIPSILSFSDLTYFVDQPKKNLFFHRKNNAGSSLFTSSPTKTILNSISGEAKQGEILAILGPSGSGKSTLIDALANRIERKSLQGCITLNGQILDGNTLKSISAYMKQDDLLYPMLTVEETLMFSAELRYPRSVSRSTKKERVRELIYQLGLEMVKSMIVGDEGKRGVSGGERRRVSIGVDIIHDPKVLFLDEPTTGLDSTSAFMVVKVLQDIAQRGSIVIMSIHQPSSRILNQFDRVLFLSRGNTIYYGPPTRIPAFFSMLGRQIPESQNLAEFVLELIQDLSLKVDGIKPLVMFNKIWSRKQKVMAHQHRGSTGNGILCHSTDKFANPWWAEVWILTKRSFLITKRTPWLLITSFGAVILTGIIFVSLFWNLEKSLEGATERLAFFSLAVSTMFSICMEGLPIFIEERHIFMRETASNTYRRSSYVLSRTISCFLPLIILSLSFTLITFFVISLTNDFSNFAFFMAIILATLWAGSGLALFLSGIIYNFVIGFATVVALVRYFGIFSGFYINTDRIPKYWLWFHYVSLIKYPYEAVIQNEFSDPNTCFVKGVQMFDNTPVEPFSYDAKVYLLTSISKLIDMNLTSSTCITTGPDLLKQNSALDLSKWVCLWILIIWGFVFRLMFYFVLIVGSKNKRK
ncbi:hypothetical protein LUZ60_003053 [Juncus effusus]|nr:hypothetical protein LUZ60_003053 [Juncus effusus]